MKCSGISPVNVSLIQLSCRVLSDHVAGGSDESQILVLKLLYLLRLCPLPAEFLGAYTFIREHTFTQFKMSQSSKK